MGWCNGMKRADYERIGLETRVKRIEQVAKLRNVDAEKKVEMIEELARGEVALATIKAIEEENK